jgi:hypothetical protein
MLFSPLRHRIASVVAVEHLFGRAPQDVFEFSIGSRPTAVTCSSPNCPG